MRWLSVFIAAVLASSACGDSAETSTTPPTTTPVTTVTTTTVPVAATTTAEPGTTTTVAPATTTTVPSTTTTPVSDGLTVASVIAAVEAEYQAWWDYFDDEPPGIVGPVDIVCDQSGAVGFGDLLSCTVTPLEDRQYFTDPFDTAIAVTGDDGSYVEMADLGGEGFVRSLPAGLFCRDLVGRPGYQGYFDLVAYWFIEGLPQRMDADRNGIPCETLVPLNDVALFWGNSPYSEAPDIFFGDITGVSSAGGTVEVTIDYAIFLTGMDANLAAEEAGEISPGEGVPNDYFIRNENPRLRTFELISGVTIVDLSSDGGFRILSPDDWAELWSTAQQCQADGWPEDCADLATQWYGQSYLPYWVQVDDTRIIRMEEQYLP